MGRVHFPGAVSSPPVVDRFYKDRLQLSSNIVKRNKKAAHLL